MRIFASHQCADYAHTSYVGAGEECMAPVTFAVGLGEAVELSKPRWPHCGNRYYNYVHTITPFPANFDHYTMHTVRGRVVKNQRWKDHTV